MGESRRTPKLSKKVKKKATRMAAKIDKEEQKLELWAERAKSTTANGELSRVDQGRYDGAMENIGYDRDELAKLRAMPALLSELEVLYFEAEYAEKAWAKLQLPGRCVHTYYSTY